MCISASCHRYLIFYTYALFKWRRLNSKWNVVFFTFQKLWISNRSRLRFSKAHRFQLLKVKYFQLLKSKELYDWVSCTKIFLKYSVLIFIWTFFISFLHFWTSGPIWDVIHVFTKTALDKLTPTYHCVSENGRSQNWCNLRTDKQGGGVN